MSPKKKKGVIIFHTPIQPGLFSAKPLLSITVVSRTLVWKVSTADRPSHQKTYKQLILERCRNQPVGHYKNYVTDSRIDVAIMRSPPQPSVKPNYSSKDQREESSGANKSPRPTQLHRQGRLPCPSIRRLQAKMETENRQTREIVESLLNTENGFIKELEKVLNQHDVTQQRRRELLHKQWTERLWLPHQKQLNQRLSSCWTIDVKRRLSLYNHFLQHCNRKGHVFLDTYNLREYDPFFWSLTDNFHQLAEMKDRSKDAWTPNSIEDDSSESSREEGKLPHQFQSSLVSNSSAMPSALQQGITTPHASSTSTETQSKVVRTLGRFDKDPCHSDPKYRYCRRCDCRFSPRRAEF